jgi:hypothetical protein
MKAHCSMIVAILLAGCAGSGDNAPNDAHSPAPPGATQLNGTEIAALFVGRTHNSTTTSGQPFTETLMQDGTAKINISGSPAATGKWSISDDVICVAYSAYGEECSIVKTDGKWFWFIDNTKGTTNNRFAE